MLNVSCCCYKFQQYLPVTTFPFIPALHWTNNIEYLKSRGLPVGFLWIQILGIRIQNRRDELHSPWAVNSSSVSTCLENLGSVRQRCDLAAAGRERNVLNSKALSRMWCSKKNNPQCLLIWVPKISMYVGMNLSLADT